MTTPADVADTPVLTAGGVTYRWSDVFLAARLRGEWEALVEAAAAPEAAVGDDELKRAGAAFRTERRLLAADELRAWLEAHRLTLADWNAYLRRRLADGAGAAPEPGADAVWAEGVCSGSFTRFAEELAARAAALAADSAAEPPGPPPADWLARMPARDEAGAMGISPDGVAARCAELWRAEAAHARLRESVIGSDAPRRALAAAGADWLRIDCEYLATPNQDVAREAILLLREDGLSMQDVARTAGLERADGSLYAGEIDHELRVRAISAAPGDPIGPVGIQGDNLFVVMSVRSKVAPSMEDPEIRARAESAAVQKAFEREIAERVTWHEHD